MEHEVRALNGLTPNSTGWAAMAKTMREVDEAKVKDYKEDIDTLLVLASLFSAVMTTFLIESYENLQEDPADISVQLLRQISSQLDAMNANGNHLNNTTVLPQELPEFEPPIWALRVNVLWFASLILSLITASFGMLVKGSLREFLAGEQTSAHTRLRVRFFRYFGLQRWKVFEIAAALPLLLQIALGLFLLGLCFFTSSVHSSVAHASVPLVSAWAFLFLIAIFSPAIASHCPYKTMLFKNILKRARLYFFSPRHTSALKEWRKLHQRDIMREEYNKSTCLLPFLEEEDIAITPQWDNHIIIEVDAILADEDLVSSVTLESFRQSQPTCETTVDFILRFLQSRQWVPGEDLIAAYVFMFPITAPEPEWNEVVHFLEEKCKGHFFNSLDRSSIMKMIMILGSHRTVLTANGRHALSLCLQQVMSTRQGFDECMEWLKGPYGDIFADIIVPPSCTAWHSLDGPELLRRLERLLRCLYFLPDNYSLLSIMREKGERRVDQPTCNAISESLYERVDTALRGRSYDECLLTAIFVIIECNSPSATDILNKMAQEKWVLHVPVAQHLLRVNLGSIWEDRSKDAGLFGQTYLQENSTDEDRMFIRQHIVTFLQEFSLWATPWHTMDNVLDICLWVLNTLLDERQVRELSSPSILFLRLFPSFWEELWSNIANILERFVDESPAQYEAQHRLIAKGTQASMIGDLFGTGSLAVNCLAVMMKADQRMDNFKSQGFDHVAQCLQWLQEVFPRRLLGILINIVDKYKDRQDCLQALAEHPHVSELIRKHKELGL